MNEDERQVFHILIGLCAIAMLERLGVQLAAYFFSAILILGMILVHFKLSGFSLGPFEGLVARFERPGVTPGYGAMTITAGILAILTLLASKEQMIASLIVLGFGDAASTLVGRRSRKKLPYSKEKTWGGTLAFFIACLPAVYFAGWSALIVAACAAAAESLESNIDDNLTVSLVCVVLFRLIG